MTENTLTLEEYIEAVENTLQYWLDIHTVAARWAEMWLMGEDAEYIFKETPIIKNDYFEFNWRQAAIRKMAENDKYLYNVCQNCGAINEDGYEDCCEEPEPGDEPSIDNLTEWLIDIEAQVSERDLLESLENEGFKVYSDALGPIIAPIVNEVSDVLNALNGAENNTETLTAVLWANHICHVHGNILQDYGDRFEIEYKTIDSISQGGLSSVFSEDEIQTYLNRG